MFTKSRGATRQLDFVEMGLRPRTWRVRRLRKEATEAEKVLWRALREADIPVKFRRQHPIGDYIADFTFPAGKLVVEIDGGQHMERQEADEARTVALNARGYRVIRFWNNEVLENLEGIMATIVREASRPPPHPNPLRPHGAERERSNVEEFPLRRRGGEG